MTSNSSNVSTEFESVPVDNVFGGSLVELDMKEFRLPCIRILVLLLLPETTNTLTDKIFPFACRSGDGQDHVVPQLRTELGEAVSFFIAGSPNMGPGPDEDHRGMFDSVKF